MSSFHHTYFTVVNGTWRLWGKAAQMFLKLKERLKCMTVLLVFTDSYRCLCPSQSSPTLGTTACWCTGLLLEPPPPGTLCSTTGETVWHSTQSNTSTVPAGHICSPWWKCLFPSFCVSPELRSPPGRWRTCRGGSPLGRLQTYEHKNLIKQADKSSQSLFLEEDLPVVKVLPHILGHNHNQVINVVVFIGRDPCMKKEKRPSWHLGTRLCVFIRRGSQLCTSMMAKKRVVTDGAWFSEGVELVQPFPGDVKLQQAGLLHAGQGHHLLPLAHRLLAALSARGRDKHRPVNSRAGRGQAGRGLGTLTCRTTHRLLRSARRSRGLLWHTGHQTHTTGRWSHSDSRQCSGHLREQKCAG